MPPVADAAHVHQVVGVKAQQRVILLNSTPPPLDFWVIFIVLVREVRRSLKIVVAYAVVDWLF